MSVKHFLFIIFTFYNIQNENIYFSNACNISSCL